LMLTALLRSEGRHAQPVGDRIEFNQTGGMAGKWRAFKPNQVHSSY
jgi:hypothetical protein